jgi:hypothetical protein
MQNTSYQHAGSMDHPVWWVEEAVAADCIECTLAVRSHLLHS